MIVVKASRHPLRDEWVTAHVAGDQTIREICGSAPVHAWIDGYEVPAELIERAKIKDGVTITVRPVPQGDNFLRSILTVAVIVVAAVVSQGGIFGLQAGGFAATAAGAGIALAGGLLINALIPPVVPSLNREQSDPFNRLDSLTGASNQVAAFQPIPRVYGTFRFFPPIPMTGQPFTELQGSDQYLRMIVVLGYGPLRIGPTNGPIVGGNRPKVTETTPFPGVPHPILIDNTAITQFDGVEFEIGRPDQMTLYTNQVIETNPAFTTESDVSGFEPDTGSRYVTDGDFAVRTTEQDATEISIDVAGQLFCVNSKGRTTVARVEWKIEYRKVGTSTWTVEANPWVTGSSKKETLRRGRRWKVSKGQYEVRLTRIRTFFNDFEANASTMTWSALRTIRGGRRAFVEDGMVVMALRIKATDQLNGRLDTLSVQCTSVLPVWNGSAWVEQPTRAPAWIYADILTGTANRRPLSKDDLNAAELLSWANRTEGDGDYYDAVIDAPDTTLTRLREVSAVGRATWAIDADTKISVIQDTVQSTPKMVISARNSYDFGYELAALEIPHALRVRFISSDTWENTERLVYDDGFNASNATLFEVLDAPGVTNAPQAWRFGRYHLAQQRLRPERYFFSQDVQHLRYRRGDLLTLSHDVIRVGIAAGRIKSVTTDPSGDVESFVSDQFLTMPDSGREYGVKIQRQDGTIAVASVMNVAPGDTNIELQTSLSDINVDDHFIFGETEREDIDVKVSIIEPQGNFAARVTCVPAASNILDALTGTIPPFDPVLTQPIDPDKLPLPVPVIERVVSDESVLLPDGDGSVKIRIVVESFVRGFAGWDKSRQIRFRGSDSEEWIMLAPSPQDNQSIFDVDEGIKYEIQVRSVGGSRASAWVPEVPVTHTVVGKSSPPSDVAGFMASTARDRVQLSWNANPELDVAHYELREGNVWSTATFIATVDTTKFQTPTVTNGPWLIKAIDTEENESVNAVSASIAVDLPATFNVTAQVVDNNVLLKWDNTAGTFDIDTHEIRKGDDVATAEVIGFSDKTFDVIFETASGTFTYWPVPIDTAGNEGDSQPVTVEVDDPPDFVLNAEFQTDWQGFTSTNVLPIQSSPRPSRLATRDFTALEGDGIDDIVQVPNSASIDVTGSAFTVEAWILYITKQNDDAFLNKDEQYELGIGPNQTLRAAIWTTATWQWVDSGITVPIGKWVYVAVTYDGTNIDFYVNDDTATVAHPDGGAIQSTTNELNWLAANLGVSEQHMKMTEVRLWSVVRTPTEIDDWRDRTLHGNETGLEGYWRTQEGSGDTLSDKGPNANDATVAGAVWHTPQVIALLPFPLTSTPNSRIGEGFNSPQDLIDAGHDYPGQPSDVTTATFEEIYDMGAVISSSKVQVTIPSTAVVGTVSQTVTISTKENLGDAWTVHSSGTEIFASDFRYIRVNVAYDSSGDADAFMTVRDLNIVVKVKILTDGGNVDVTSNPTAVTFSTSFVDVTSLEVSPQGTTALIAVPDFTDVPNPTGFDVYLFDNTGNPATGTVRWAARGV